MQADTRRYDLVLFGASGFTGTLTAEHLARAAPAGLRWALAGRSLDKLERVREGLGGPAPDLVRADVSDLASLRELAESTRVVATTVGPYLRHGEPLVAAAAAAGTGYLDLTGEPEFVDRMFLAHHATAERSGARLVHACGFDSIPHDLAVLLAVQALPEGVPLRLRGYLRTNGLFSGGTFDSAMTAASRPRAMAAAAASRRRVDRTPSGRTVSSAPGRPGYVAALGSWVLPLPTLDPAIIARSARTLPRYGPDFSYRHHLIAGTALRASGIAGATLAGIALAQLPPVRALGRRWQPPGTGPSPERRARSSFSMQVIGEGGGRTVTSTVAGGDPGYTETAVMLGEAALCLALDDLPETAGQVTTAAAMGDALVARLRAAGLTLEVAEGAPTP